MPGSVNKAIIVGNLGADPELRYTSSGTPVCELRIATNEKWKDKQGQQQGRTEWHKVTAWGKTGENAAKYLSKGRQVYVEGRLETQKWQDKQGNDRYTTQIVARDVQFLAGGGQQSGGGHEPPPAPGFGEGYQGGADDDLPF